MDFNRPSFASIEIPCEDARIGQVLDALEEGVRAWIDAAREVAQSLEEARAAVNTIVAAEGSAADGRGSAAGADVAPEEADGKRVVALPPSRPSRRKQRKAKAVEPSRTEKQSDEAAAEESVAPEPPPPAVTSTQQETVDPSRLDRFAIEEAPPEVNSTRRESEDDEALLAGLDPKIAKQLRIKRRLTNKRIRTLLDEMNETS